jgi:hypothetical protein
MSENNAVSEEYKDEVMEDEEEEDWGDEDDWDNAAADDDDEEMQEVKPEKDEEFATIWSTDKSKFSYTFIEGKDVIKI